MVGVRAANSRERSKAINKLQVTPLLNGLSGATVEALMNLKRRTAMITEVFVIDIERDRSEVIVLSPDTARVIVVK